MRVFIAGTPGDHTPKSPKLYIKAASAVISLNLQNDRRQWSLKEEEEWVEGVRNREKRNEFLN